jgi:hypothetical protein
VLALEISLNGKLKAVCGSSDCESLAAYVRVAAPSGQSLTQQNAAYLVQCLGFPKSGDEVLKWVAATLQAGDEISIRLIETETANQPIDRQKFDPKNVPES